MKEATLEETPLERFVFDLDWIALAEQIPSAGDDWQYALSHSPFCMPDVCFLFGPDADGIEKSLVEDHLRAFLLKLNAADSYLLPNPPGKPALFWHANFG